MFYSSISVSPSNSHSVEPSILFLIRGWYNRPTSSQRIECTQSQTHSTN
jgi:hypothetical protein